MFNFLFFLSVRRITGLWGACSFGFRSACCTYPGMAEQCQNCGARPGWTGHNNLRDTRKQNAQMLFWSKGFCSTVFNPTKSEQRWELVTLKAACYILVTQSVLWYFQELGYCILRRFGCLKNKPRKLLRRGILQALKAWYHVWFSTDTFLHWVTFARPVKLLFSFRNGFWHTREKQTSLN